MRVEHPPIFFILSNLGSKLSPGIRQKWLMKLQMKTPLIVHESFENKTNEMKFSEIPRNGNY